MINQYQKPARYALSKIELKMEVNERIKEMFEHRNPDKHILKFEPGLNEDVVRNISKNKNEPEWMDFLCVKLLPLPLTKSAKPPALRERLQ